MRSVLEAGTSLRGTGKSLTLIAEMLNQDWHIPDWTTIRNWLLRYGLGSLKMAYKSVGPMVWLVDCSIQIGTAKCFLVIGVALNKMPEPGQALSFQDCRLIDLHVLESCTKKDIATCLRASCQKGGVPTAIVSDHGAEITGGVQLLQEMHPEVRDFYDIKHKAACLLKKKLETDATWQAFQHQLGQSKFGTQQTSVAYASPPSQRSKARFMNLDRLIKWGLRVLRFIDRSTSASHNDISKLKEKFSWLKEYRASLERWNGWQEAINISVHQIACHRLTETTADELTTKLSEHPLSEPIRSELIEFVRAESRKLTTGELIPASTEILESCFGKLKYLERTQEKSGFTRLVVSLAAMFGKLTPERLRETLSQTKMRDVEHWSRENLPITVQSQRKQLFHAA